MNLKRMSPSTSIVVTLSIFIVHLGHTMGDSKSTVEAKCKPGLQQRTRCRRPQPAQQQAPLWNNMEDTLTARAGHIHTELTDWHAVMTIKSTWCLDSKLGSTIKFEV
jgi:hypothetical protein